MKQVSAPVPRSTRAYRIFLTEVREHLELTERLCAGELTGEECGVLKNGFHRAKGGAGFFGLSEMAELSAQLEAFFSSEQAAADLRKARPLLAGLKSSLKTLEEEQGMQDA